MALRDHPAEISILRQRLAAAGIAPTPEVEAEVRQLTNRPEYFRYKPPGNCRICRHDESRRKVNELLANGLSYREVFRVAEPLFNPGRAKNDKITYDSVFNHATRHFNLEQPAQAVYRRILERHAQKQEEETWVEGVSNIVTAFGYLDVMAQKGYQTLVKDDTVISPALGMDAAVKLHDLTRRDSGEQQMVVLRQQLAVIQAAVKDIVPAEYWPEIVARIEEHEAKMLESAVDAEVIEDEDEDYDDDGEFDPIVESDSEDSLEP